MYTDTAPQPDDWDLVGGDHAPHGSRAQLQRLRDILHGEKPYGDRGRGVRHRASPAVPDPGTSLDFGSGWTGMTATGAPRAEVSVAEGQGPQPVASDNAD
jgi:hypothetical protein